MKKYLKAVVSGLCAAALALGCVSGSSARKVLEYGLSDLAAGTARPWSSASPRVKALRTQKPSS